MNSFKKAVIIAASLVALAGCAQKAPPAADAAADEAAIRLVNPAWFAAYNAHDVNGVVVLYADDAVLNIPGAPPARGHAEISAAYAKDIAASAAAGITNHQGTNGDFGVSGDLGWEWNTFTVTDASGATIESGKYVTVYARKDGKWLIIRDIWNMDGPPAAAAPAAEAPAT